MSLQPTNNTPNPTPNPAEMARAKELMSAAVLGTLADAERTELLDLQSKLASSGVSVAALAEDSELAIGEAIAAMSFGDADAMPASARDRLEAMGRGMVARGAPAVAGRVLPSKSTSSGLGGWMVAAVAAIVAAVGWLKPPTPAPVVTAMQLRTELLAQAGSQVVSWSSGNDPSGKQVEGDIVWNTQLQQGFLRFKGAARNDPAREQYQLWIFDKARAEFAVDGGVFNVADNRVDQASGDIIIPVNAKLRVFDPELFAVTLERPDGVVVTDKGRIVVTAAPTKK